MNKILFLITWLFISINVFSQGNLEFSQVKLVGSTIETVPTGKVWKIESVLSNNNLRINTSSSSNQTFSTNILINGTNVVIKSTWGSSMTTSAIETTDLPIWLPAGTTLQVGDNVFKISVIEFNTLP